MIVAAGGEVDGRRRLLAGRPRRRATIRAVLGFGATYRQSLTGHGADQTQQVPFIVARDKFSRRTHAASVARDACGCDNRDAGEGQGWGSLNSFACH